jgi:predicted SAM-dependent methyltransferase
MRKILLALFSHRFLAIGRWDLHFLKLRLRNAITGQRAKARGFLASRKRPAFLNLGSGPRGIDDGHWVNIDGFWDRNVHFASDFGRPLPFPDASFDGAFSEHVLEHFLYEDGRTVAKEIHRLLKPDGCFRVIVPDAELIMRRYFDAPAELVLRRGEGSGTAMEAVNSYFRQRYEHQFMYDWETMEKMLREAGFATVLRARFGESAAFPALVLDDEKYEWESLYVEAIKASGANS